MNTSVLRCATIVAAAVLASHAYAGRPAGAGSTRMAGAGAHVTTTLSAPTATTRSTQLGPTATGQPNQSCGSATAPFTPGNSATAPGSAFNPSGQAGSVYAGEQPQNSVNTASVSQYDVACFHQR